MLSWFLHMISGCYLSVASVMKLVELLLTFSSLLVSVFLFEYCVFQSMLSCLCGVVRIDLNWDSLVFLGCVWLMRVLVVDDDPMSHCSRTPTEACQTFACLLLTAAIKQSWSPRLTVYRLPSIPKDKSCDRIFFQCESYDLIWELHVNIQRWSLSIDDWILIGTSCIWIWAFNLK